MKESAYVMGILFLETGANSIIWEMRRLYSPKLLIVNDLIGMPYGMDYSMISITYKRLVPASSVTVGQKGYLIIDKASFWIIYKLLSYYFQKLYLLKVVKLKLKWLVWFATINKCKNMIS